MKLVALLIPVVCLLQGCFDSEADKQAAAAKKQALFQNMYNRGIEERRCDMLPGADKVDCWKQNDKKWTDVPSAYAGEPPAGLTRSSKRYEGTDGPKVPLLSMK